MEGSEHKAKAGGNLGVPLAPAGTDPRGFRALWLSSLAWACVCVCVCTCGCVLGVPWCCPPPVQAVELQLRDGGQWEM